MAYLIPGLVVFLEVGLPIGLFVPGGDTALGVLAGEGGLSLFLGAFWGHLLGYRVGLALLKARVPERGEDLNGPWALLLAPFLPGIRTAMPLLLGAMAFPLKAYIPHSPLASQAWSSWGTPLAGLDGPWGGGPRAFPLG